MRVKRPNALTRWIGERLRAHRPVFICGVAGSGTTLMVGLLDQHFENVCCLHESALSMPEGAALRIEAVADYAFLAEYRAALLPGDVSPEVVRAESVALYQAHRRPKARSNVVLDKAPNAHLVRAAALRAAFPASRFLLIYRDPADNIEGLRRKWPAFRDAKFEEVCGFWEEVHGRFLDDVAPFRGDVRVLAYERLVRDPEAVLKELGEAFDLRRRRTPRPLSDRPDAPGKGLRNVVGGKIEISRRRAAPAEASLAEAEMAWVRERLRAMCERLDREADWK